LFALWLLPATSSAYPWMIKYGYTGCATCHGDPSGAGVLTPYGRAQDVLVMTTRYGRPATDQPGPAADFAFGLAKLPEWPLATATYRGALLVTSLTSPGGPSSPPQTATLARYLNMLLDARAQVRVGAFVAALSLGYGNSTLAYPAAITR